jgi:hypothetical protein
MCRLQIPRALPPQNLIADLLSSFSHLLWTYYRACSAIQRKATQLPQNMAKSTLARNMEQVKSADSPCFLPPRPVSQDCVHHHFFNEIGRTL